MNELMDSMRCFNCVDGVYMVQVSDHLYRCPVCGDEYDPIVEEDDESITLDELLNQEGDDR